MSAFDDQETGIGPQPGPQTILLACTAAEIFFGGALGSGKSYALGLFLEARHQRYGGKISAIVFRQTSPELEDLIKTFKEILEPFGWEWRAGRRTFVHSDGAECRMRHCENERDVRKYWGHQYCVARGTPIVMADGSRKPIEDVRVGEMVLTLEGPKRVKGTMASRMSECVKAEIYDQNGVKVGEQIHPTKHPLLSIVEERDEFQRELRQNREKSSELIRRSWISYKSLLDDHLTKREVREARKEKDRLEPSVSNSHKSQSRKCDICEQSEERSLTSILQEFELSEAQESQESDVSPRDDQSCCRGSGGDNREWQRLPSLTCPAVLHEPTLQLYREPQETQRQSTEYCSPGRFDGQQREMQNSHLGSRNEDLMQIVESLQLPQDYDVSSVSSDDASCVLLDSRRALSSQSHYLFDHHRRDEQLLQVADNDRVFVPSEVDAVEPSLDDQRQDEKGSIQQRSHHFPVLSYIHPYTAMPRDVVETVQIGSCRMTPVGVHEVFDLSIEDANHYISGPGCVSKNTDMYVDELGDFPEATFWAIQKIRAARLRSAAGIPVQFVATGNPCGVGHKQCKERYIDPAPAFTPFRDPRSKHWTIFIPGRMENNIRMLLNDPEYRDRCKSMGPDWYVQALINGDWSKSPEGNMFHREWFNNRYNPLHLPKFKFIASSWDTAFKTTKDSARSAVTVWGLTESHYYLLYGWAGKVEFPEAERKIEDVSAQWNCNYNWIEDKASGQSLAQTLKRKRTFPIKAIKVDGDKTRRAFAVTPFFESGKILIPDSAPWLNEYIEELCAFPAPTGYADYVDSSSQGVTQLVLVEKRIKRHGKSNVVPLTGSIYGV